MSEQPKASKLPVFNQERVAPIVSKSETVGSNTSQKFADKWLNDAQPGSSLNLPTASKPGDSQRQNEIEANLAKARSAKIAAERAQIEATKNEQGYKDRLSLQAKLLEKLKTESQERAARLAESKRLAEELRTQITPTIAQPTTPSINKVPAKAPTSKPTIPQPKPQFNIPKTTTTAKAEQPTASFKKETPTKKVASAEHKSQALVQPNRKPSLVNRIASFFGSGKNEKQPNRVASVTQNTPKTESSPKTISPKPDSPTQGKEKALVDLTNESVQRQIEAHLAATRESLSQGLTAQRKAMGNKADNNRIKLLIKRSEDGTSNLSYSEADEGDSNLQKFVYGVGVKANEPGKPPLIVTVLTFTNDGMSAEVAAIRAAEANQASLVKYELFKDIFNK